MEMLPCARGTREGAQSIRTRAEMSRLFFAACLEKRQPCGIDTGLQEPPAFAILSVVREELEANPDIVYRQQMTKVIQNRGRTENTQRRHVSRRAVVLWYLAALAAVALWALRLYGVIDAPF